MKAKFRAVFRGAVRILLACSGLLISCSKSGKTNDSVVKKGDRHLGAHLSIAAGSDYPAAYAKARTAGIDCVPVTLQWSAMESNGKYDPAGFLEALNGFYAGEPVSLALCVSPFAADRRDLPRDLISTSFDDPTMIVRFNILMDTIHARLPGIKLRYLVLGNEVDLYLSGHSSEWTAYGVFCRAVRLHALSLWGTDLKIGAETTLGATIGTSSAPIRVLQDSMDLLCLTYYPLRDDFFMEPSSQVQIDFASLFSIYPSRPVLFQEIGYATGAGCGGSDSAQVNFMQQVFRLWDARKDQISFLAFLWLNDLSQQQAARVTTDYGLSGTTVSPAFTEYIRTLGLCDYNGNAKPGFQTLQQEALKRGWTE